MMKFKVQFIKIQGMSIGSGKQFAPQGMFFNSVFFVIILTMFHSILMAQVKPTATINRKWNVYGVDLKTVSMIMDERKGRVSGVAIKLEKTIPDHLSEYRLKMIFWDAKGKQVFDTVVNEDLVIKSEPLYYEYISDNDPPDTVMYLNFEAFTKEMENPKVNEQKRILYKTMNFWPAKANKLSVGIISAKFGWTTYFAPGF